MMEKPLCTCPSCGVAALQRVISAPYVITHEPKSVLPSRATDIMGAPRADGKRRVYMPKKQGGLYGVAMSGNGDIILHEDLAGPPPGHFMHEGRVLLTDTRKQK